MAVLPDTDISTRRIEGAGKTFYAKSYKSRDLAEISGAFGAWGNALERMSAVKQRADEREGEYAVMQATDYCKNGYEGWEKPLDNGGSEHQRGVLDLTYDELARKKTTIGEETTKLLDSVRAQDFYKRLSPSQRAVFERKWVFRRNEFLRSAETAHQRLTQNHIASELKGMIAKRGDMVAAVANNTPNYTHTARWAATQNMKDIASSEIENPEIFDSGELDWEAAVWGNKIKWRGGPLTDEQKAKKIEQYRNALFEYDIRRISIFQQAGARGEGMKLADGSVLTPEACLDAADRMTEQMETYKRVERNPETGELVPYLTKEQAGAIRKNTKDARKVLEGVRAALKKTSAEEFAKDFRARTQGLDDTRVAFAKRAEMETLESYAARIDSAIESDALDEKTGEAYIDAYRQVLGNIDFLREKEAKGDGVWVKIKNRKGQLIDVFEPFVNGSPKSTVDEAYKAKYSAVSRGGEKTIWDDPVAAMDELEYDYHRGRIPVSFYEAELSRGKMLTNIKAKAAYVKVFGADDWLERLNRDDEPIKYTKGKNRFISVWAKTKDWSGKSAVDWLEDAQDNGWFEKGEELITDEQRKKIYDTVCQLAEEGVNPEDAIRQLIAPTLRQFAKTDLDFRLDPNNNFVATMRRRGNVSGSVLTRSVPRDLSTEKKKEREKRKAQDEANAKNAIN